jgi:hypothetical protein
MITLKSEVKTSPKRHPANYFQQYIQVQQKPLNACIKSEAEYFNDVHTKGKI